MNNLDRFKISVAGNFYINNRSLIDIVKEIELPLVQIENNTYIEEGEDPKDLYIKAGDYISLFLWMSKFP